MPPTTEPHAVHPAELYRGIYTQPYNEIVQPGRVWTVSKYFLRRWSAYLNPAEMWLVIGARQLSYLNRRRPWFSAYDSTLADAAGLNVDVYRRTVKRAIADQEGFIARFLSKDADPAYVVREDVPRKGRTRYTVRLDDPLTPADAAALAQWLHARLPPDAGGEEVQAVLKEARRLEPQSLWASELSQPDGSDDPVLYSVADVVCHLLPHLHEDREDQGGWQSDAGALHTHLVAGEIVHLEPHYFREQWLPALGPGPALLIVTLRSYCYLNEETGEIRDVVNAEAHDLAQRLQTTTRTLRRWFKKLQRAAAHDALFGPFFTLLESSKQPDQKVIAAYRINLKMPLSRDDHARYLEMMSTAGRKSGAIAAPNGQVDKKSATSPPNEQRKRQKVPDEMSVTAQTAGNVEDKKSATQPGVAAKLTATIAGGGQKVGNAERGAGRKVGASQTNGRPFKYYERLLSSLNIEEFEQLEQRTEQQYQHLWHIHDGQAGESFAAVAAGGSLAALLGLLGIHEPARGRILQGEPSPAQVVAWHLYARRQSNLEQPLGYVVARLLAGDTPPQPFLALASLSWEQWRTYAALAHLPPGADLEPLRSGELPYGEEWLEMYGTVNPENLPFEVGQGLDGFRIVLEEEPEDVVTEDPAPQLATPATRDRPASALASPQSPPSRDDAGSAAADRALWQETLTELSLQMTQSTFDAWLRQAHLVSRDGHNWVIGVATPAAQSWLENRLCSVVERTLGAVAGEAASVRFVVGRGSRG